jgi:ElaB/YqjD/DUF883 family membrane-anchored ribosome-binding protein
MDAAIAMAKGNDVARFINDKDYQEIADALYEGRNPIEALASISSTKKDAPWQSSWMRKGLENEIKQAISEGKQQLAVPIKNGVPVQKASDRIAELSPARTIAIEELSKLSDESDYKQFNQVHDAILSAFPRSYNVFDPDFGEFVRQRVTELVDGSRTQADIDAAFDDIAQFYATHGDETDVGTGINPMMRSPGVQKWYETTVAPTVEKLAKQMGTDFKIVNHNGVEYAVIDLAKPGVKESADKSFKLYAGGGAVAYYMATVQSGMTPDEVTEYMLDSGFTEEEVAQARDQQDKVAQAAAQGIPLEDISAYLEPKQTTEEKPEIPELSTLDKEKQEAMKRLVSGELIPADELQARLQVIAPNMSSVTTRMAAFFGDQSSVKEAEAAELAAIKNIQELWYKRGVNASFQEGKWVAETPDGPVDITPGFIEGILAEKGELVGSTAGGIYGALQGARVGVSPWQKAAGAVTGGVAGAVAGGVLGTELDYLYQSMKLQEDMSAEIAAHKALTAAEAAAYGEVIGLGLYKFGGAMWKGAKRVKNFVMDGNSEGARKALRDNFFLSEDEINELVARFEKLVDTTGMSTAEKEIKAVATSVPGAESLVKAAAAIDPQASRAVVKNISDRAERLLRASSEGTTETARVLKQDLDSYVDDVKGQYNDVKMRAAQNPRNKYYKFDLKNIAVKPVLESLASKITDPSIREKFLLQMNQAQRYTDNRTFSDLVELRQLVNEFRFNKRIVKPDDYKTLDAIITNIDAKLEKGANWLFGKEGGKQWIDEFAVARADYAQMKKVQSTALYKLINRPGITPEAVSKALLKYSDSIDDTYESVMSMLPKDMRRLSERDMINQLVTKYTVGSEGGIRATQFPMLAKDLSTRSFVDDESRQLVKAIEDLSDVFRNDIRLAQNAGHMTVPQFQSYLTADPIVRAKFEIASTVFNAIKQRIPGSKASRDIALIRNAAKFLETPLNAKSINELKELAKDVVSLDKQILEVQRMQAQGIAQQLDQGGQTIPFYGNGKILKAEGTGTPSISLPAHRIASPDMVRQLAVSEGLSVDSKLMDDVLKRYGYKAAQYGSDKIRLLD